MNRFMPQPPPRIHTRNHRALCVFTQLGSFTSVSCNAGTPAQPPRADVERVAASQSTPRPHDFRKWDEPAELVDSQIAAQAAACGTSKMSGASPTSAWRAPAFVSASGTPPSDTATTSGPGRALALQFAHPHLGHESKYAPIITCQRKEPCP